MALGQREVDVLTLQEAGAASEEDESQLVYASGQGRILLSHNQLDFRRLHATFVQAGRSHGGIMLIPQTVPFSRLEIRAALMLDWTTTFPDLHARLFTWSDLQQRLIQGCRLPHWTDDDVRSALGQR